MRIPALATILVSLAAGAPGQSLGDAARQEAAKRAEAGARARRGETAKPLVFTDSDLTHSAAERPEVASASPASESAPATKAGPSADPVRQELDREAERRQQKESEWRAYMASVTKRFEAARLEHQLACGPKAINLAGG